MTDLPVEVRIGDRERRAVDARLQSAVGEGVLTLHEYDERAARLWEARTSAELSALVADLPTQRADSAVPPAGTSARPRRSLAVMSGDVLRGPFAPGQRLESYAVMGGATVDLRRDDLPAETRVRAVAVMGGVEVLVPRGATVHLSGAAVMGGRECRLDPPVAGAPVVHVEAWAVMGGVEIRHGKDEHAVPAAPPVWAPHTPPARVVRSRAQRGRGRRALGRVVVLGAVAAAAAGALGAGQDGAAVFGSRTVSVVDSSSEVTVLFGSVEVVVPDDVQVRPTGMVVFGSVDCEQACRSDSKARVVEVQSLGGFGSVTVRTQSEADAEAERRRSFPRDEDVELDDD